MNSPPTKRCNLHMGCNCNCSHHELIDDASLMPWMRTTLPPPLGSEERRSATERPPELESEVGVLNDQLDETRRRLAPLFKIVADITQDRWRSAPAILVEFTKRFASFSTIPRIPNEILGYIFSFIDPPELPNELGDITSLCLVSKAWNMAVPLAPELWTKWRIDIHRHLALSPTTNLDYQISLISQNLEKFLIKSMNRQLNFRFTNYEISFTDRDVERSLPLLNIITQSIPRWNRFRYQCGVAEPGSACFCSHLLNALKMGRVLDDLEWEPCENWTLSEDQLLPTVKMDNLNTLSLIGRNPIPFPFLKTKALTDLSLCDLLIDYDDVSILAMSLPNLLILRCHDVASEETGEDETARPVLFQQLRDLHMTYCDPDDEFSSLLALIILHHAPTISNVHRTIDCWGSGLPRPALHSDGNVGKNISFLEFDLDVLSVYRAEHKYSSAWRTPIEITDWLRLPNLTTVSLVWTRGSDDCRSNLARGNNNRLAALLLDTMSTVGNDPDMEICPRLEHVKCYGVTCDKPLVGMGGTEAFLLALENFSWNRSRMSDAPNYSTETIMCLVSVAWNAAANSAGLPDLVNANWEDVSALLDNICAETDTNASDLSEDEDAEEPEGSGDTGDLEDSSCVAEEGENQDSDDSSWIGEDEEAESDAEEAFKSHYH